MPQSEDDKLWATLADALHTPEDITRLAQEHFAQGFPNPQRIGCPAPGTLTSLIHRRQAPDEALHEHLFRCSECHSEYQEKLAAGRAGAAPARLARSAWLAALWSQRRGLVAVGMVVVIASLWGWRMWSASSPQVIPSASVPASAPTVAALPERAPDLSTQIARALPSVAMTQTPPPMARTVQVDLDRYASLRDVTAETQRGAAILLTAERVQLRLHLPEGSTKGRYTVRLVNAFGRTLRRAVAFSSTGQTLTVTLDLRSQAAQHYRLQISRGTEAPDYYPVTITEKRR